MTEKINLTQELKLSGLSEANAPETFLFLGKLSALGVISRSEEFKKRKLRGITWEKRATRFWPRFVFAPLGALLLVLALSGGAVFAAQGSLPGSPLYPVKRLSEKIAVWINPNFHDDLALRRSEEIRSLVTANGNAKDLRETLQDFQVEAAAVATTSAQYKDSLKNLDDAKVNATGEVQKQVEDTIRKLRGESDVKGTHDQRGKEDDQSSNHSR